MMLSTQQYCMYCIVYTQTALVSVVRPIHPAGPTQPNPTPDWMIMMIIIIIITTTYRRAMWAGKSCMLTIPVPVTSHPIDPLLPTRLYLRLSDLMILRLLPTHFPFSTLLCFTLLYFTLVT